MFQLFMADNLSIKYDGNQTCCVKCIRHNVINFYLMMVKFFFGNGPRRNMFDIQVYHVLNQKIVLTSKRKQHSQ